MARIDNIPPAVEMESILLDKLKVAARQQIGPQVLHDMELRTHMDYMTDRMIVDLRSHVYAHKVDSQEVTVPFSKTETISVAPRRYLWTFLIASLLGLVLTAVESSWPAFVMSCATALAFVIVHASNPPKTVTARAEGTVTVSRDQWNAFPDNSMVYPKTLGSPVELAIIQPPEIYYQRPGSDA